MKRTYISPEFQSSKVRGTFNMLEKKSFFGSKMIDVQDEIYVGDEDIIYYQKTNSEQVDLNLEKQLPSVIYSSSNDKNNNHTLSIVENQGSFEKRNNTRWKLTINLKEILTNYIFANLKSNRTFEGVLNVNTRNGSVNKAIQDYIEQNLLSRYEFSKIVLYLTYNSLLEDDNFQSIDGGEVEGQDPAGGNSWNTNINSRGNIETKVQTKLTYNQNELEAVFPQAKPRSDFNFDYYFDLVFIKS